jgi:hypothetical protein
MSRHDTKNDALALAIAGGASVAEAAAAARVSISTVKRRRADVAFMRRVAELRNDMIARAAGKAADAMVQAVETLRELQASASDVVRKGAAQAILEHGAKLRDSIDLAERIAALERRLGVTSHGQHRTPLGPPGANGRAR